MIEEQPKAEWQKLPRPGCHNVEFRLLLQKDGLAVANLRFGPEATIDRHSAGWEIDVICLAGEGIVDVGDDSSALRAGETVRWPAGVDHCLRTAGHEMETLMIERHGIG